MKKEIVCPLCSETMTEKKAHQDTFWECLSCKAEVWPADERIEKEVRRLMTAPASKKKSAGRRKSRFKAKKPGEKFTPWYQR